MITLIQGPICSGKTTLAKALKATLSGRVSIIEEEFILTRPGPLVFELAKAVREAIALGDVIIVTLNPRLRKRIEKVGIDIQRVITVHGSIH